MCKSGWSYFGGICYSTSQSCKNWTEAQKTCQAYSANLASVRSQEENVYLQHRMNGAKGWIGLNDRGSEGTFVWADNQANDFTYWATNQPNNFNNEDCVHTLGVKHSFLWNDVGCDACHNYTCSEGIWEPLLVTLTDWETDWPTDRTTDWLAALLTDWLVDWSIEGTGAFVSLSFQ